ncbi:MAG: UvrD-helicase domain-containing protein [Planctomycetes bacterium]|nr:UvrD-helicase domain-containing protein [Planctomycetota bacterium]
MTTAATEAQQRAISARGGDVCVAAGAGSGKTFVLVERFVGLVRDGLPPERILTITFTEKAASEMAERIGRALQQDGKSVEGAWISTIHGFCARLLREKAIESGVDPAFGVLTDVPAARVRRQAFIEAQRLFRAERPGAYDGLVERVRWGRDQDGATSIRRRVLELYDELRAAGVSLTGAPAAADEPLDALWPEGVRPAFERLAAASARFLAASGGARRTVRLERQVVAVREAAARLAEVDLDGPFRAGAYHDLMALANAAKGAGALADELAGLREAALAAAGAYAEGPARALGRGLEDLLRRFDARFRALKAAQSALDFSDLEERTKELLEARPDVREEVQRRFQAVLVDEFQDTSRLQQRIVDLVRRPGPAAADDGGFFAVGDVKQSIYAFRHAEVRGLLDLEADVRAQGGEVVALDLSFRTRPEVLGFVDEVFALAWGEPGSEVPHQPLRAGAPFGPPPGGRAVVELVVGKGETLERARALEARAVAARLATLIEGRVLAGTNPLRKDTFGQPLRYRDCAVLLPATTALPAYERALRERGVPYRVASGRGFYGAREVVDAVGLLAVAAAAHDDLALAALLRSPAVGLSDTALQVLAERRRELPARASLADALEQVGEVDPDLEALDGERARRARDLVAWLRAARGRTTVRDLLAGAFERCGLMDGALLRGGDLRGHANLHKLLVVVEDLEREGAVGPAEVAAVLEDLRHSGAREPEANVSSEEEDAVSVLTVHAAKGLEWPLVVVADMGRHARPESEPVLWCERAGILVDLRDPDRPEAAITSGSHLARTAENRARAREESKRLLYVAMTRAQDHLILAGAQGARAAGDWLAWARGPLAPPAQGPVAEDVAAGGVARLGATRGGVTVRLLDVLDDVDGTPIRGPKGPAAGARPVLDAPLERTLARAERPRLPGVTVEAAEAARRLVARADAPGLPDPDLGASVYTVSEVLTWRACPRRHLLEHVVGDREPWSEEATPGDAPFLPETDEVPADVAGTLAHEVVAGLHGVRPLPGKLTQRLAQLLLPRTASRAALERAAARALELRAEFERSELGRRVARADEVEVERPFLVAIPDLGPDPVLLRGTIDLLLREGDRWTVVDHKAAEVTALQVPGRLEQPELQLRLYAIALAAGGRPPAEAQVMFLAPGVASRVDLGPAAMAEARRLLVEFVEARRTLDLPPRPHAGCRSCPHRPACPAGQARMAEVEIPVALAPASGNLWALTGG